MLRPTGARLHGRPSRSRWQMDSDKCRRESHLARIQLGFGQPLAWWALAVVVTNSAGAASVNRRLRGHRQPLMPMARAFDTKGMPHGAHLTRRVRFGSNL